MAGDTVMWTAILFCHVISISSCPSVRGNGGVAACVSHCPAFAFVRACFCPPDDKGVSSVVTSPCHRDNKGSFSGGQKSPKMAGFWLLSGQMCRYGIMTPLEEHGYAAFFKGCHYFLYSGHVRLCRMRLYQHLVAAFLGKTLFCVLQFLVLGE